MGTGLCVCECVARYGLDVFRMSSYFLKNDYAHLEGVGEKTILKAWEMFLEAESAGGQVLSDD